MFSNQLGILIDHILETLCVPLEKCLSVNTGPVDESILSELERRGYDQAPVYHVEKKCLLGLVETERLRRLYNKGEPLSSDDPAVCDEAHRFEIGASVTVEQVLDKMGQRRAILVIRKSLATEPGERNYGLLTMSDLNRQHFRAALYPLLAELESEMARLVESEFENPLDWVNVLTENHQVQVLGYWEVTKLRGVDIGSPIAGTTLSQLINVISKSKAVRERLGYGSGEKFKEQSGKIPCLRNRVMHPVRPLVLNQDDVKEVRATVASIADLYARVRKLTARGPGPGRRAARRARKTAGE
ncbi:MAG: hypothetical protein ACE5JS_09185 [Nitrospinota bacterium]